MDSTGKRKRWEVMAKVKLDVFTAYCGTYGQVHYFNEAIKIPGFRGDFCLEQKYVDEKFYSIRGEVKEMVGLMKRRPPLFRRFLGRNDVLYRRLVFVAGRASKGNLRKASNMDLAHRFVRYAEAYMRALALVVSPMFMERAVTEMLDGLPVSDLLVPAKQTATLDERIALLRIAAAGIKGHKLQRALAGLVQRFSWTGFRFFEGRQKTIQDYAARLEEIDAKQARQDLSRLQDEQTRALERKKRLLKRLKLSKTQRMAVEHGSETVYLRTHRLDLINFSAMSLDPLVQEICTRLGITRSELIHLTPGEIAGSLRQNKLVIPRTLISQRKKGYAIQVNQLQEVEVLVGKDMEKARHEDFPRAASHMVRGISAFSGKVQGRVVVAHGYGEGKKLLAKGDILVTHMTTPDWVSVMERAAAIITDIGGLTSHSAVVARELGIPCIVGTGNATAMLRGGDWVEVDAGKGIVRILKKAE